MSCPYSQSSSLVYADGSYSGFKSGNLRTPYNTLTEAEGATSHGCYLHIKEGSCPGPGSITMHGDETIRSYMGTAVMEDNIAIFLNGVIKLYNTGDLKIY